GGAVPDLPAPPAPTVPASDPEGALAAVSALPPAQLAVALGKVSAAATANVGEQKQALAASPPQMERPSGSPQTRSAPLTAGGEPPVAEEPAPVEETPQGEAVPTPAPEPLPAPPPPPTQAIVTPEEPTDVAAGLGRLPTRDPEVGTDAGPPPRVELEGNADPQQARDQKAELHASLAETEVQGRQDVARDMGENQIYPVVPAETLKATVPAAGGGGGAGGAAAGPAAAGGGGGGADDAAISIIAQEEKGSEISAAATTAKSEMATARQDHAKKESEEREASHKEIAKIEADSASRQDAARADAKGKVAGAREEWSGEQETMAGGARTEADTAVTEGEAKVEDERSTADEGARAEIESGNEEAAKAKAEGEEKAAAERRRGEEEADSGGIFGWIKSKAKAFFDGIKKGIQAAFDAARKLVKAAIEAAKKAAVALIEKARQAIVAAIRAVGDALIAIGDRLLAGFPALRDRFRATIKGFVEAAEKKVNELADQLKKDVVAALDALGSALDAALGLLEKGLLAAVDAYAAVVNAAIAAAKAVADAIGAFVALISDVAAGPGQWISNLGASVVDGIKNHLWAAFQTEVKNWFNSKLEEVLGVGPAVWDALKKGGITLAAIGKMAFEALKSAIPTALVEILLKKLVSMIVPAAGAVMAIIEGLQAAWGTVSRIITAFSRFIAFLKAVKPGNAGPQFASALAAAAVVVIDFVANWLLAQLGKAAKAVGGRVKAIAKRILDKLKKVAKKAVAKVKKAAKKAASGLKKKGKKKPAATKPGKKPAKPAKPPKKKPAKPARPTKPKKPRRPGRPGKPKGKKKKDKEQNKQKKLKALRAALREAEALFRPGAKRRQIQGQLPGIKARYRLRKLKLRKVREKGAKTYYRVRGTINPTLDSAEKPLPEHPSKYVEAVGNKYFLKKEYQNTNPRSGRTLRARFYGTRYRSNVRTMMREQLSTVVGQTSAGGYPGMRHPTDPSQYQYGGAWYVNAGNTRATIEHKHKVVDHWNSSGKLKDQGYRLTFHSNKADLEVMPKSVNLSEGATTESGYEFDVGEGFRGPGDKK
ncbi:MAG: hypothetical protein ABW277_16010, partial [Longimicrobiaceae bacterium]